MKYNERIREIREDHALTQQKVADLLHIGQRTYSDYESGKTRIPIDNIMILAKFYDISMDYLNGLHYRGKQHPATISKGINRQQNSLSKSPIACFLFTVFSVYFLLLIDLCNGLFLAHYSESNLMPL